MCYLSFHFSPLSIHISILPTHSLHVFVERWSAADLDLSLVSSSFETCTFMNGWLHAWVDPCSSILHKWTAKEVSTWKREEAVPALSMPCVHHHNLCVTLPHPLTLFCPCFLYCPTSLCPWFPLIRSNTSSQLKWLDVFFLWNIHRL